jgi:hypothetical protein
MEDAMRVQVVQRRDQVDRDLLDSRLGQATSEIADLMIDFVIKNEAIEKTFASSCA